MKLIKLLGIMLFLMFCVPDKGLAADLIKGSNEPSSNKATSKQVVLPKAIQTNKTLSEETGLKKVLPYYAYPFTEFKVSLDKANRQVYQPGESLSLKGQVVYPSQINGKELEKIKQKCKEDPATGQETKSEVCGNPEIYKFSTYKNTALLAQVWREDQDQNQRKKKGDFLVDEFYVFEGTTLKEGVPQEFVSKWVIPGGITEGKYYVSFFLNQEKSFSLLGFPVNVFAPYTRFDFLVTRGVGENKGVVIDKNNIKINGEEYSQVMPIPLVAAKENKLLFEVPVANLNAQNEKVTVLYELQKWTEENPKNLLASSREEVNLQKGEKRQLSFVADLAQLESFSNLKITAFGENNKSVLNIHFAVSGKNGGVLRFLGLAENQEGKLLYPMFCPRNAQWSGSFPGKIKITLTKSNGESQVWEKEANLEAKDAVCFVLTDEKMRLKSSDCAQLKGEIFDLQNKVVDQQTVSSDCGGPSREVNAGKTMDEYQKLADSKNKLLALMVLLIIVTALTLLFIIRRKHSKTTK